jgi:hypothetical protein
MTTKGDAMSKQLQRWVGIGGLVFFVLVTVSIGLTISEPSTTASLAKVTKYYASNSHHHLEGIAGIITMVAVVVGTFWLWYFRQWLVAREPASRNLATVGFGGGLILAVSGGIAGGLDFTMSDAYHHMSATGFQVLNTLKSDGTAGASTAGVAILMFAVGLAAIRYRVLPLWLGWVGIVFAVLGLPSGLALPGFGLWLIIVSVIIIVRSAQVPAVPEAPYPTLAEPTAARIADPPAPLIRPTAF